MVATSCSPPAHMDLATSTFARCPHRWPAASEDCRGVAEANPVRPKVEGRPIPLGIRAADNRRGAHSKYAQCNQWEAPAHHTSGGATEDQGPARPGQPAVALDLPGRGLTVVVAGLSRDFGVLPAAEGGKLVWAAHEAHRSRRSTSSGTRDLKGEPLKNASALNVQDRTGESLLA